MTATTSLYSETLILGAVPSPLRKEEKVLGLQESRYQVAKNDVAPEVWELYFD